MCNKDKDNQKHADYIWNYYSLFLDGEPSPGIVFDYKFLKIILPEISLAEINELPKKWITETNRVISINGPDNPNVALPSQKDIEAAIASIKNEKIIAYDDKVTGKALLETIPKRTSIVKSTFKKDYNYVEWTLKNGVRVAVKPTKFKEDEIMFTSFSFGGSSLYSLNDYISAQLASSVINESGVGDFSDIELKKMLAGKIIEIYPVISDITEGIEGRAAPSDIEDALKIIYLYFTKPHFDSAAFATVIRQYSTFLENKKNDPESVFQDSISVVMSKNHPFARPWDSKTLNEATFSAIQKIYCERFADASDFVFTFVGNIDTNTFKPLVETYLGNLPSSNKKEMYKDLGIQPPKGVVEKTIVYPMIEPRAHVYFAFTGLYNYDTRTKLLFCAIEDILEVRYTETIREDESGTYGVDIWTQHMHYPANTYQTSVSFNCAPSKAEKLSKIVLSEIENLRNNGPEEKYLNNFKTNKIKEYSENIKENEFWMNAIHSYYYHKPEKFDELNYEEMINNLTIKDVKEAINTYFNGNNYVKLILTPQ